MVSRRDFLHRSGAAAASALLLPYRLSANVSASSDVYVVHDDGLVDDPGGGGLPPVVYERVKKAYDAIACNMTGEPHAPYAWEALFPGIAATSKIALKINCLQTFNSPSLQSVQALIACLTSMFEGTFPASNIALFDNVWYTNTERVNVVYKPGDLDALGVWHGSCTYDGPAMRAGGKDWYPTKQLADADFGIAFGVSRPHCCHADHLSASIKNMLGAISTTHDRYSRVQDFHGDFNGGAPAWPMYAELFKNGMKDLIDLYISDWIFVSFDETQPFNTVTKRLVASKDPCAIDSYAVDFFDSVGGLRASGKGVPLKLETEGIGSTQYVEKLVDIDAAVGHRAVAPIRTRHAVTLCFDAAAPSQLRFTVPLVTVPSRLEIRDGRGRKVRLFHGVSRGSALWWDGRCEGGERVSPGFYTATLFAQRDIIQSRKFAVVR